MHIHIFSSPFERKYWLVVWLVTCRKLKAPVQFLISNKLKSWPKSSQLSIHFEYNSYRIYFRINLRSCKYFQKSLYRHKASVQFKYMFGFTVGLAKLWWATMILQKFSENLPLFQTRVVMVLPMQLFLWNILKVLLEALIFLSAILSSRYSN